MYEILIYSSSFVVEQIMIHYKYMNTPDYKKATDTALMLLKSFEIRGPVIPVDEIAQREGIAIQYFRPDHDKKLEKVSGFFDPDSKTIYVNSADTPTRQLFTIAHELGHFELQHNPSQFDVLYRFATPIDKEPVEQEANCFAANLLVPEEMLAKIMKKYNLTANDFQTLADLFGVSAEVMKYRLRWILNANNF